jgi:signal transduction histidine kinase
MLVNFGLIAALNDLKEMITSSRLVVNISAYGFEERRLREETEITVYRIIQELLNNVIRHAKASEINIELNLMENLLSLIISDNGQGFDPESVADHKGIGLQNLSTRVRMLKGTFYIDSGRNNGATFLIDIPVPP